MAIDLYTGFEEPPLPPLDLPVILGPSAVVVEEWFPTRTEAVACGRDRHDTKLMRLLPSYPRVLPAENDRGFILRSEFIFKE